MLPLTLAQLHRSARPLHSLSVLAFDQERLERKVRACCGGAGLGVL